VTPENFTSGSSRRASSKRFIRVQTRRSRRFPVAALPCRLAMVKELDVCVRVPCPPRLLLRLLYSDDGCFLRSLHAAVTHDAAASVTPWLAGKRTVNFTKTLDLPAALLKLLGACAPLVAPTDGPRHTAASLCFTRSAALTQAPGALAGDLSAMPVVEQQELLVAPTVATVTSTAASKARARTRRPHARAHVDCGHTAGV